MHFSPLQIIIVVSLFCSCNQLDYNPIHTPNCQYLKDLEQDNKISVLWNIFILHIIDQYFFLILCPIIFFIQLIVIITYYKHPLLLIRPGSIFCGLILIEMIMNLSLLINGIYHANFNDSIGNPMPPSFPAFCESMSFIFVFLQISHFLYLVMFLFYTIIQFRFTLRKKPKKTLWRGLNATLLVVSLTITFIFYFLQLTGLSYYGICQMTLAERPSWNEIMPWASIGFSLAFVATGIFTLVYFKRHIPKSQIFQRRKISQNRTISMLVIGFSFFLILLSSIQLVLDLNCLSNDQNQELDILVSFSNISRLFQYLFLIIIIIRNGTFRSKLKITFRRFFSSSQRIPFVERQFQQNPFDLEELAFDERLLVIKQKSNQIDLLLTLQIYTIITGIYIAHYEYHRDSNVEMLKEIHYKEKISFLMDNQSAMNYQPSSRVIVQLKVLRCSVEIHAPRVFHRILENDGLNDIYDSFRVIENLKKIWNSVEGRGGKSGEFFYFSANNKYVLKTVTIEEFQFLMENLQYFVDYYICNPKTLLTKIYGVFTIRGDEIQRTFRLILMKNILGCPKNQVLRIYDMKGSEHDRQVIKNMQQLESVQSFTLKDTDFLNFQNKLQLTAENGSQLRQILDKDTTFLKNLNLIDYSLLVVRVNWLEPSKDPHFWSQLQRMKKQNSYNEYYHIGIIDYMQKWDFQKKGEKWWKNLIGKRNVSAADPYTYQQRFSLFVSKITNYLPPIVQLKQLGKQNKGRQGQYGKISEQEKLNNEDSVEQQFARPSILTDQKEKSLIKQRIDQKGGNDQKITRGSSDLKIIEGDQYSKQGQSNNKKK